ncbi:hypothetical protein HPB47_005531 [Ixodes persulcatus]|uniref:Uncharacterized protein n=1 Tax=Ixodes persulcatus TaxID=34615 RepID=A0AC60PDB0_IXOPE|nr:hypothetical protein HPB47_005531 [Ixodes persulcatus]
MVVRKIERWKTEVPKQTTRAGDDEAYYIAGACCVVGESNQVACQEWSQSILCHRSLEKLKARLTAAVPDMLWLRYAGGACQPVPPKPPLPICDGEDLSAISALDTVLASLSVFSCRERAQITADTLGQADNPRWHRERVGRVTASEFAAAVRCENPDYLLKRMFYPKPGTVSEAMTYGREHKPDVVASYVQLLMAADIEVEIKETGLGCYVALFGLPGDLEEGSDVND